MNSTAQQHALEQANLITQLIKYADRVVVVESASDAERRAFVKLIDDQLPESVGVLALRASPNTDQAEILQEISSLLQLSPGIESPRQLAAAIVTALGNQGRLLTVIENADAWYQTTQWSGLMAHIQAANKTAPNHWLFLLTGAPGLAEKLRSDAQLADLSAEIHRCELLGETDAPATATAAASSTPPPATELHAEERFAAAPPAPKKSHGTALLVAAALSIAVVTFGGFALLTRSHDTPTTPTTQTLAVTQPAPVVPPPTAPAQADNPLPNDGANSTPQAAAEPIATAAAPALIPPKPLTPPESSVTPASPPPAPVTPPPEAPAAVHEAPKMVAAPALKPATEAPKPAEKSAPRQAPTTVREEKPVAVHEEKTVAKPRHEPVERAKPTHEKPAAPAPVRVTGVDNAWYRQQKAERAVLQLGAFNDEKAALAFIKAHAARTPLADWHIFTQKRAGQTLYTVTVGNFAQLSEARSSANRLPEAVKKLKPYPRSFKAITEIIQ